MAGEKIILIEDNVDNAIIFLEALCNYCDQNHYNINVIWLHAYGLEMIQDTSSIEKQLMKRLGDNANKVQYKFCAKLSDIENVLSDLAVEDDLILYDVQLDGINSSPSNVDEDKLLPIFIMLIKSKSVNLIVACHSNLGMANKLVGKLIREECMAFDIKSITQLDWYTPQIVQDYFDAIYTSWSSRKRNKLKKFLDTVSRLKADDCHSGKTEEACLNAFVELLDMKVTEFKQTLDYDKKKKVISDGLKTAAIKDQDSISYFAAVFIAWAAFRNKCGKAKDHMFINAIRAFCDSEPGNECIRDNCISPCQKIAHSQNINIRKTIEAMYEMFAYFFEGDTLERIDLDKTGLSLILRMDPTVVLKRVNEIASQLDRALSTKEEKVELTLSSKHQLSRHILRYWLRSNIANNIEKDDAIIFGSMVPLRLIAHGTTDDPKTMSVILQYA